MSLGECNHGRGRNLHRRIAAWHSRDLGIPTARQIGSPTQGFLAERLSTFWISPLPYRCAVRARQCLVCELDEIAKAIWGLIEYHPNDKCGHLEQTELR